MKGNAKGLEMVKISLSLQTLHALVLQTCNG